MVKSNNDPDQVTDDAVDAKETTDNTAIKDAVFETLAPIEPVVTQQDIKLILDVPVKMTVELGRTRLTIKQLLNLTQGSIVSLEGIAGESLDILINGYLIAQGEVVVVGDQYGVRITDIITPAERMNRLNTL